MPEVRVRSVITVLPGLWIAVWYLWGAALMSIAVGTIITILLCFSVICTFLIKDRVLSKWSYPALGSLLWLAGIWLPEGWLRLGRQGWGRFVGSFSNGFYALFEKDPFWFFNGVVVLFILLLAGWIYLRSRLRLQRLEWLGLGLLGFVTIFYAVGLAFTSIGWPFFIPLMAFNFICLFVMTIIGLRLARRDGLAAGLLVTVCEPLWVAMVLRALPPQTYLYRLPDTGLTTGAMIILILPALSYLVAIPLGLLNTSSRQTQVRWMILSSALTLCILRVVAFYIERDLSLAFPLDWWLLQNLTALQIWVPVLVVAGSMSRQGELTPRGC